MGEPARKKVAWDDEVPAGKAVAWDAAPDPVLHTEPQPPAPTTDGASSLEPDFVRYQAPEPPKVGRAETAVTELQQGGSFELADEAKAAERAVDNYLASKGVRPLRSHLPIIGPLAGALRGPQRPETVGRGMGSPLKGYGDYFREAAARRAAGREQNPGTAVTANLAGSVASGLLVPPVKAAQGAGLLARTGAGLANVGVDTAIAAGTAAAGADEGQRMAAAKGAVVPAAALSAGLRAVPAAVGAGFRAVKESALSTLPDDVAKGARVLTEASPEGAAARAAARAGQEALDPTTRAITKTLSEGEELADAVMDYAKIGLKRAPIVRHMAAEGVDAQRAVMATGGAVERIGMELQELAAKGPGEMEVAGKQAVNYALDAFESARDQVIEALGRTGEAGGDAAADAFMRVDNLKRQLGRAVKRSSKDPAVEERLMGMYDELRTLLENESVWGKGASTVQREVNAAWTPWLTQRKAFSETALANTARKRGADARSELKEADPAKISSLLESAGRASNDLKERDLQQGLETTRELTRSLAKHYDAPPDVVDKAARVAQGTGEVLDKFGKVRESLVRARELADVRAVSPKTAAVTQAVATAERAFPRATKAAAAGADVAPELARKAVALQQGRSSAEAQRRHSSDGAVDDPRWGRLLSSTPPGKKRDATYATLIHNDPDFRARERERGQQRENEETP